MRISRAGLLFLPLLLTACSLLPINQPTQETSPEANDVEIATEVESAADTKAAATDTTIKEEVAKVEKNQAKKPNNDALLEELKRQTTLAQQNATELETRVGNSIDVPAFNINEQDKALLESTLTELKALNNTLTNEVVELDKRVEERRNHPQDGDVLKIYLSDLQVENQASFKAQPIVGHWVRGESRMVRLNENLLAENSTSEPFHLTFSEKYQILINNKLIGTFGPSRSKYKLDFDAPTSDDEGHITGTLSIRTQAQ